MSRVLVVDDHEIIRTLVAAVLGKVGHEVHSADNGREGLDVLPGLRPDLVLLDLRMPVLDGNGFLEGLDKIQRPAVIALTGHTADLWDGLRDRVDGYLDKPFDNKELTRIVREILGLP